MLRGSSQTGDGMSDAEDDLSGELSDDSDGLDDIALTSVNQALEAVGAWGEAVDGSVELGLCGDLRVFSVEGKFDNVAITSSNDQLVRVDCADGSRSERTEVQGEDEHLGLRVEAAHIS